MFSFKDVIGQTEAKERLIQEVQERRIPHAQLFCGPAGAGKLPLALAYARYISCPHRTETDACGSCPSCAKWEKLVHPDVHFMFPIVKNAKKKKEVCDDYLNEWRHLLLTTPYFGLNHWLDEMDAENGQAIIYAKESDEILRKLIAKGKALELNSHAEGTGLDFLPEPDTLRRYRELGGELVTFGSDAHAPENIARNFDLVCEALKAAGFKYLFKYKAHSPIAIKLD